ncbi:MAG: hypothetical protein WCJ18_01090 [Planctomycetota bacterium]
MSTASIRSSRIPPADEAEGSSGALLRWGGILVALALLAFLFAWFMGWIRFTTDPRVVEIRKLQEEARQKFVATGGPNTLVEATEAAVAMTQIRQKVESLPKDLRPQVERSGGSMFRTAMRARIDGYFALPPEKRQAELDRQIKQEEMMRKAFETAGAVAGAFGGRGGPNGAASGGTAGNQPGGGPPRGGTEESRNNWRKQMIDSTTPEQRARYVEYRRAMEQRREQLGIPSGGPR